MEYSVFTANIRRDGDVKDYRHTKLVMERQHVATEPDGKHIYASLSASTTQKYGILSVLVCEGEEVYLEGYRQVDAIEALNAAIEGQDKLRAFIYAHIVQMNMVEPD